MLTKPQLTHAQLPRDTPWQAPWNNEQNKTRQEYLKIYWNTCRKLINDDGTMQLNKHQNIPPATD